MLIAQKWMKKISLVRKTESKTWLCAITTMLPIHATYRAVAVLFNESQKCFEQWKSFSWSLECYSLPSV